MPTPKGTRIEVYVEGAEKYIAVVSGVGAVPDTGDMMNILGKTYRVLSRTWAIDKSDSVFDAELRCNIDVEPLPEGDKRHADLRV